MAGEVVILEVSAADTADRADGADGAERAPRMGETGERMKSFIRSVASAPY